MPRNPSLVSVQTYLKPKLVERIDALGKRLNMSRSTMVAELLEVGVDQNERIIRAVTHPAVLKVMERVLGKMGGPEKERKLSPGGG